MKIHMSILQAFLTGEPFTFDLDPVKGRKWRVVGGYLEHEAMVTGGWNRFVLCANADELAHRLAWLSGARSL